MAINNLETDYPLSKKQLATWKKTSTMTTVAAQYFNMLAIAGDPGAGVLAGTNTANGVIQTSATAGYVKLNTFQASAKGYVWRAFFTNTVASSLMLADVLFKAGAYAYNANTTLSSQPDLTARIPDGDWKTTEIWIEAVTAFTGNQTITITYTNQDGVTGKTTGAIATGVAPTVGRVFVVPFASGDSGVRKIESVVSSVSTAGTFNVLIVRPILQARIPYAYFQDRYNFADTGMVEVFQDSALQLFVRPDSTSAGLPEVLFEIANK